MDNTIERKMCPNCKAIKSYDQFYSHWHEKRTDIKYTSWCKKCIRMSIDPNNPNTYISYLKELDVPWIYSKWYNLIDRYGNANTIFGKYLAQLQLAAYRKFRWKDNFLFFT